MKKLKYLIGLLSILLLTSCDISNEEIEKKAQAYMKSQYGIPIKLVDVEIVGDVKEMFGPSLREATVQQTEAPHIQFKLFVEGEFSPAVTNDNYKIKKDAYEIQEQFKEYAAKNVNSSLFTFEKIDSSDVLLDKETVSTAKKKNPNSFLNIVLKSNELLDFNNSVHMEELAAMAQQTKSFNQTIKQSNFIIEDMNIILPGVDDDLLNHLVVDYLLTAEDAKKTLEKREDYMRILQNVKQNEK
ncbi:hypothetical protein QUF99_15360 [Bacillus sp. DX4.1]|uniref:hypothetical protein n=1 Tax=Bacillus sp. DX4.1 TaxID=3055867 RepID=UPI0025A04BF4|nr:hypothetical protein [Bacillus sp. DX4.1]MDM5188646.1 hypothetical protein [Bacillus sp. DX4.1]